MRSEWNFPYKADVLAMAGETKALYHLERRAWWAEKREETLTTIKASGIEIEESVAGSGYNTTGYARGAQVNVKPELTRDLQECLQKVKTHHELAENYLGWVEVLKSQGEKEFQLDHDDWMFFFGKK